MLELYVWKEGRKDGCGTDGRHIERCYDPQEVTAAKKRWKKLGYVGFELTLPTDGLSPERLVDAGEL